LVEAYFANTRLALRNRAAMAAGIAADALAIQFFVEIALANILVNDITEGRHREIQYLYFTAGTKEEGVLRTVGVEWFAFELRGSARALRLD
jgi:hypothetical protein